MATLRIGVLLLGAALLTLPGLLPAGPAWAVGPGSNAHGEHIPAEHIWNPGNLKPVDSHLRVHVGQRAPDFTLPSLGGQRVSLSDYRGQRYVILSFVPAAFTPVCSEQWPGYNLAQEELERRQAVILGISVDNLPTLHAWTSEMGGCWFPVLSDFYPHGLVAARYGILRGSGTSERAVFIVDKRGVIRYIDVHDINGIPRLESLFKNLDAIRAADGAAQGPAPSQTPAEGATAPH